MGANRAPGSVGADEGRAAVELGRRAPSLTLARFGSWARSSDRSSIVVRATCRRRGIVPEEPPKIALPGREELVGGEDVVGADRRPVREAGLVGGRELPVAGGPRRLPDEGDHAESDDPAGSAR